MSMRPAFRAGDPRHIVAVVLLWIVLVTPVPAVLGEDVPPADPVETAIGAVTDVAGARGASGEGVIALGQRAVPPLRRRLGGDDPRAAEIAAILLGRLGGSSRPALGDLVEALEDDAESVRAASAQAIESIGWPHGASLDALVAKGADPDLAVRRVAFRAALDTGRLDAAVVAARLAEHETRAECALALRGLRGRAVETLATLLTHPSRHVRRAAAEALATSGTAAARVAPALAASTRSSEAPVRDASLRALFESGDASEMTRRAFLDAAGSSDNSTRAQVVLALADPRFDHVETDRVLAAAAGDPDEWVRLAAALGAGVRGRASEAQHVLLARTTARAGLLPPYPGSGKRGHTNLRAAGRLRSPEAGAAWPALRSAGAPATLQALRAAWQGAEERECVVLLRAFTAIGEAGVADIRARLDDPSRVVRREAALCLATLGDTGAPALPVLVDLLSDEADARDQPEDHYGRADAPVVAALVARMPAALPPLAAALEAYAVSPDERVRPPPRHVLEVLEAAGEKAAPAAVAVARVIVETPYAYPGADAGSWTYPTDTLDALRALGAPVTHALADRLLDVDRDVRWRARHALGDLGKSATPALDALDRAAASGPEAEREQYAALARSIRGQP